MSVEDGSHTRIEDLDFTERNVPLNVQDWIDIIDAVDVADRENLGAITSPDIYKVREVDSLRLLRDKLYGEIVTIGIGIARGTPVKLPIMPHEHALILDVLGGNAPPPDETNKNTERSFQNAERVLFNYMRSYDRQTRFIERTRNQAQRIK